MIVQGETAIVPELKELWLRCFMDTAEDVEYFFNYRYQSCECLVDVEAGRAAAMAFLLPAAAAGTAREVSYLYAFAVHPDWQGRGIATRLLSAVCGRNRAENRLTVLSPADEGLAAFYEKRGFVKRYFAGLQEGMLCGENEGTLGKMLCAENGGTLGKTFCAENGGTLGKMPCGENGGILGKTFCAENEGDLAGKNARVCGLRVLPCPAERFAAVRSRFLMPGDICWDTAAVRYAAEENRYSGGACLSLLFPDGTEGAALVRREGETLCLRELLLPQAASVNCLSRGESGAFADRSAGGESGAFAGRLSGGESWGFADRPSGGEYAAAAAQAVAAYWSRCMPDREPFRRWRAYLPGTANGKAVLMGMADEAGACAYLNLLLD